MTDPRNSSEVEAGGINAQERFREIANWIDARYPDGAPHIWSDWLRSLSAEFEHGIDWAAGAAELGEKLSATTLERNQLIYGLNKIMDERDEARAALSTQQPTPPSSQVEITDEDKRRVRKIADELDRLVSSREEIIETPLGHAAFLRSLVDRLSSQQPPTPPQVEDGRELRSALEQAADALKRARDGLDLGLGQARINTGDQSPMPTDPATKRADFYLRDARLAEKNARAALHNTEGE